MAKVRYWPTFGLRPQNYMNFFKKFFSVKNQNLTKNGPINSFLNKTVKDNKFWFSATIRNFYKLKIFFRNLGYIY